MVANVDCWLVLDLLATGNSRHLLQSCFFPQADPNQHCCDYSIPDSGLWIKFFLTTWGSSLPISLVCPDQFVSSSSMLAAPHDKVFFTNLQRVYSMFACTEHYQPLGNTIWNWLLVRLHVAKLSVPVTYSHTKTWKYSIWGYLSTTAI